MADRMMTLAQYTRRAIEPLCENVTSSAKPEKRKAFKIR